MELLFMVSKTPLATVRVKELEARHHTKIVYVDEPAKLKSVVSGEIWAEVFHRISQVNDQLEQSKSFLSIANPSHTFTNLTVKKDVKSGLYSVYADVHRHRELTNGRFGIRGSGVIIDDVRHFNNVISIDWVDNTV